MPGLDREVGEIVTLVCDDSLDDSGYVLTYKGATNDVQKADSSNYNRLAGVNYKSTEDPFNPGSYLTNQRIAVVRVGVMRVQLAPAASRSTNITKGDPLAVLDAGKVAHWDDCPIDTLLGTVNAANLRTALTALVGIALEDVAANVDPSDGKILCYIKIGGI